MDTASWACRGGLDSLPPARSSWTLPSFTVLKAEATPYLSPTSRDQAAWAHVARTIASRSFGSVGRPSASTW
jgi:hypothetical protein